MYKKKMYACFTFFPDDSVKRWKYVPDLRSFGEFLNRKHPSWKYFNVYDKGTKQFLKRFYRDNIIPQTLMIGLFLLTQKFTFREPSNHRRICTLENTFEKTTFIYGFNKCATNPTNFFL